jgi:hypothetical protein
MRVCLVAALLALPGLTPALAADPKPSEESVRHLFESMHTSQIIDSVSSQMSGSLRESLERATGGKALNPQQQQLHNDMRAKTEAMLKDELSWARLEPQMIEIYRSTFTPAEIDGMLKFYDSPGGKAVVAKLPQATEQMVQLTQERMRALIPRIVDLQKETAQKIQNAATPAASPAPATAAPAPAPSPQPPTPH